MDDPSRQEGVPTQLIRIRGTVQGVGFRPFIARLAARYGISGWVRNDEQGVTIRASQGLEVLESFASSIRRDAPPAARIDEMSIETDPAESVPSFNRSFKIIESSGSADCPTTSVTPDLATCPDCREELLDPENRRHRYPFTNCTNCGPRYSIIHSLPYDRERTTMSEFTMCPACAEEYADPADRRYHAQPNACQECGPALSLTDMDGNVIAEDDAALTQACHALKEGNIVAIKGLGGFHLFTDACSEKTVNRLRERKHRDEKPFAVMFPSLRNLRNEAEVSEQEAELLESMAAPIVLVRKLQTSRLPASIAPGNPWIGAILPYTPLHILLMERYGGPLVATSANLSEEPLCSGNDEAVKRLGGIADLILLHDRGIARPVDDSVQRVTRNGPLLLRRARGYAPSPLYLPAGTTADEPILSLGGHLKSTIAITMARQVVLSPHIGDLSNSQSIEAFNNTRKLLVELYGGRVAKVTCDLHPDYISTQVAESLGLPIVRVQHHLAHVLACLLEHGGGPDRVLGVSWDGTGYGEDGTIWGGEFILVDKRNGTARRVAHLKPFRLPGGEAAIRQTGRCALGALHAGGLLEQPTCRTIMESVLGSSGKDQQILRQALEKGINSPVTTSAGRLFDAAAALLGLARHNSFEGQAGMAMEFAAGRGKEDTDPFSWKLADSSHQAGALELDWSPMLEELCTSLQTGTDPSRLAFRFHKTLSQMVQAVAKSIDADTIALTGGCFQNAILSELTTESLGSSGFNVLLHHSLSPNDNSISAGQALAALWNITRVHN